MVALAVVRRRSKHVPELPATEQIHVYDDIPMCVRLPATEQIYDTPMCAQPPATEQIYVIPTCAQPPATEQIYVIPKCETKLSTMNETTKSDSNEIPVYLPMI